MLPKETAGPAGPYFSVVIPAFNAAATLERCLLALRNSTFTDWECIVVDDGSTDETGAIIRESGFRAAANPMTLGPALSRNRAADIAVGRVLFFTDADCAVHSDTLERIAVFFSANPTVDAVFGSYDRHPEAKNFVSQYKNLFHHFVHQTSSSAPGTFWTGCGAVRRDVFLSLGGFDAQTYRRPSIEDIEFGSRMTRSGHRVRLRPEIQVTHLKRWGLGGLVRTDILHRGIPWTELLWKTRSFRKDLNLQTHNRVSVLLVWLMAASLLAGVFRPPYLAASLGLGAGIAAANLGFYRFLRRERGALFAVWAVPLHWLFYFYNGIAFAAGTIRWFSRTRRRG